MENKKIKSLITDGHRDTLDLLNDLRESEKRYAFLAQAANEMAGLGTVNEIYIYTARKINQLLNKQSIVAIVEFNHKANLWRMQHLEGLNKNLTELSRLFGFDLRKAEGEISTKYHEKVLSGRLVEMDFDLPGLFNNKVQDAVGMAVRKLLSVGKMYCIALQLQGNLVGNIAFITNKKTGVIDVGLLEAFVIQVGNFLNKSMAEEELKSSYKLLEIAGETAKFGGWSIDLETRLVTWSDAVADIHEMPRGYAPKLSEGIGFYAPEWQETIKRVFTDCAKRGISYDEELEIISGGGVRKWVRTIGEAVKNEEGKIIHVQGSFQDITARKIMVQSLRESEEQYRRLFETMSQGVIYQSANGTIISANPAAERILGLSSDQMQGKTSMDPRWKMVAEDGREVPGDKHPTMIALKTGKKTGPVIKGIYVPEKDEYVWLSITATPLFQPGESMPFQSYAVFDDITSQKLNEDKLKKHQQLINKIFDKLPIGIAVNLVTPEVRFEMMNDNFAKIYGVSRNDLETAEAFWEIVYEDEKFRKEIKDRVLSDLESGDQERMRWNDVPITKNGQVAKYITAQNIPLDDQGKVISVVMDVTDRKQGEIELIKAKERAQESEYRFKALHNASFGGIAIHDKGLILDCNQGLSEISGYAMDELIGMDGLLLIAEQSRELVMKNILAGYEEPYEAVGLDKSGKEYAVRLEAREIPYKGKPVRVVEFRDITMEKIKEQELIRSKEKAQESDRLKSAFLANMSHEIRTPMNAILGFSELLKNPQLTGDQKDRFIVTIEKSGQRMLNLINDIVNISKIESGLMEVSESAVNVHEVMNYIFDIFKPEFARQKPDIEFQLKIPSEEITVPTDREKLQSVLINLVSNAGKFTQAGFVEFGFRPGDGVLNFFVKDSGIGIPKDKQEKVFERFFQVDVSFSRGHEGSGLGLSIAKAFVELLGGEITLESEPGKGSAFCFTLPFQPALGSKLDGEDAQPGQPMDRAGEKKAILVVEDDQASFEVLQFMLEEMNAEILHAASGEEGITKFRERPGIGLILMDIKMPGIDGLETTRRIRAFDMEVPIIAQTAHALSGDREIALQAGCNDYISKPIKRETLLKCVGQFI